MAERPSGARGRDVTLRYLVAVPVAFLIGLGWGSPTPTAEPPPTVIEQRIALTPEQNDKLDRLLAEIRAMNDETDEEEALTPQERHIVDETGDLLEDLAPSLVDPPALVVPYPTAPTPTEAPPTTAPRPEGPVVHDLIEPETTTTSTAP